MLVCGGTICTNIHPHKLSVASAAYFFFVLLILESNSNSKSKHQTELKTHNFGISLSIIEHTAHREHTEALLVFNKNCTKNSFLSTVAMIGCAKITPLRCFIENRNHLSKISVYQLYGQWMCIILYIVNSCLYFTWVNQKPSNR